MIRAFIFSLCIAIVGISPSWAENNDVKIDYHSDPVFKPIHDESVHPMSEVKSMAESGDTRAQFILADLYAKGKGGFAKSSNSARKWFQESARNGNHFSFIRLAALEKRLKQPIEAYKWYTLAIDEMSWSDDARDWAKTARTELVKSERLDKKDIKKANEGVSAWKKETRDILKKRAEEEKQKSEELKKGEKKNVKN